MRFSPTRRFLVAIPYYNNPDLLSRALDALKGIAALKKFDLRIYISDDASQVPPNPKTWENLDGLTYTRQSQNKGLVGNYNECVRWIKENGPAWSLILDSDDIPHEAAFEGITALPANDDVGMVVGGYQIAQQGPSLNIIKRRQWSGESQSLSSAQALAWFYPNNRAISSAVWIHSDLYLGGDYDPETAYCCDWDFYLRAVARCCIVLHSDIFCTAVYHEGNNTWAFAKSGRALAQERRTLKKNFPLLRQTIPSLVQRLPVMILAGLHDIRRTIIHSAITPLRHRGGPSSQKPRVLFFTMAGLGDNLFSIPAMMELEDRYQLTVVVPSGAQVPLFERLLPHTRIIGMDRSLLTAFTIVRAGWRYDYWLYAVGTPFRRARLLNLLSFARHKYAFTSLASEKTWQAEIGFDICLAPDLGKRAWKNTLRLLTLMDPSFQKDLKPFDYYVNRVRHRLTSQGAVLPAASGERRVIIHAGCNKYPGHLERYKRWPLAHYFETVEALIDKNLFTGADFIVGPADEDITQAFEQFYAHRPGTSSRKLFSEKEHANDLIKIAQSFMQIGFFIGNDSGLAHLAALVGIPTVVLMSGIGQPYYTAPDGQGAVSIFHPVACQGCTVGISDGLAVSFECPNAWACMASITPAIALSKIEKHLTMLKTGIHEELPVEPGLCVV